MEGFIIKFKTDVYYTTLKKCKRANQKGEESLLDSNTRKNEQ